MKRLYVGTRKGLFIFEKLAAAWELVNTAFIGVPVSTVLHDARDNTLYVALNHGHFGVKLQRSDDGGSSWEEITTPIYPPQPKETEGPPWSLVDVWILEAGSADQVGSLWAGTLPGGLFRSTDRGQSWVLVRSLWDRHERLEWVGGGFDQPGIHSICVHPADDRRLTLGVSCGGVWQTTDAGENWTQTANGMRAEYMPPAKAYEPNIQDPHRLVQCPARPDTLWAQHHNGIFKSSDGGNNWQEIEAVQPSAFGFAVVVHPLDPDTAWFVPAQKDECRVPVNGELVVTRTRDGGASFEVLRTGLPQQHAYDLVLRHAMDIGAHGETLAFGSTTGSLWLSEDMGDHWSCPAAHLPPVYCLRFAPS